MTQPAPLIPPATASNRDDSSKQVLRCNSAADFLAALPRLVGFTASHSLFVVFFSGNRSGAAMRVDLPPSDSAHDVSPFVESVYEVVQEVRTQHETSSPALVISSAQTFAELGGHPWRLLARRLERRFARDGDGVRELCCIAPDAWASYLDPTTPILGRSLEEIQTSDVATSEAQPPLESLGAFPAPPVKAAERIANLLHDSPAETLTDATKRSATALVSDATDATAPSLTHEAIAEIIRVANSPQGWTALFDALVTTAASARLARSLTSSTDMNTSARNSASMTSATAKLHLASERLVEAVSLCPESQRSSVIAICAMAWWLRGLQSVAHRQIEYAREIDPENEISEITQRIIASEPYSMIGTP